MFKIGDTIRTRYGDCERIITFKYQDGVDSYNRLKDKEDSVDEIFIKNRRVRIYDYLNTFI